MSSSRYPDSSRYPRERSPYRDRRASTYTPSGYPPRGIDSHGRSNVDSVAFPPRDVPRGPKSLVDAPRGPISGPSSAVPSGPREGRGRGFPGRGDGPPSLRDAPPLTSSTHGAREQHNSRDHWRADRDRDRDFRDRRPSPPRRSPIRDSRDFTLNIDRARRNSRDGPLSAGSAYSDPPLGSGSSYRGSGIGRGRGVGRDFGGDFRPRGRGYHNDDRDRHHDPRDVRDRMYRPRSRSREPIRRDRDLRDDREFDRRERDDRRFERREEEPRRYDSYQGSASFKPSLRSLDTHRGSVSADSRNLPNTPTGPVTPHSAHHAGAGDRAGPSVDTYSRRTSVVTAPLSAKDVRRESDQNDLIFSRAEISKERYAPRASSPPASVPAFGYSNVWRNPALDAKSAPPAQAQKSAASQPVSVPPAAPAPAPVPASVPVPTPASTPASTSVSTSISTSVPALATTPHSATTFPGPVPAAIPPPLPPPPATKPNIPSGLATIPPTGPKADRLSDRPHADIPVTDSKSQTAELTHTDTPTRAPPPSDRGASLPSTDISEPKAMAPASQPHSPPVALGIRNRAPPSGPQAALRPNVSPSFSRPLVPPYAPRDASPGAIPSGPRHSLSISASSQSAPVNIPTGPKADRANPMVPRQPMYGPPERPPFAGPRLPLGGPKNLQWVRPGLNRQSTVPTKREFPTDDRDRAFGTAPKAPRLEGSNSSIDTQRPEQPRPDSAVVRSTGDAAETKPQSSPEPQPNVSSSKPSPIKTRRSSDISMPDVSPVVERPPLSAVPVPKDMEDSDEDFDLDEEDFAESEAKYNREKTLLEAKLVDLTTAQFRATTPLKEIVLLSSLGLEHLPQEEPKLVDEEVVSPPVQPPPESIATELLTPRAEEVEDVVMEDKQEISVAPATRALRLRPEMGSEREMTPPDVSTLPYLVSGPPTPLSDPDHDRPSVPDSVLLAIRDKLRKDAAPDADPEDVLKDYAASYKRWRLSIQDLDHDRDQDDQEAEPYEPALKATTPDVTSASVAALLDVPHTTGRRGYTSRFPTELDIEQVLKESLKTAEEERMGKRDKEPKVLWDPEREATVPSLLSAYEVQRRRFIDTNFQREPGQGVFVYHYEPPEDDFTEAEHKVMVQHYRDQYAKKWGKLAEILHKEVGTSRTYKDTINHYYATKWNKEFKHKSRRRVGNSRKSRATRKTVVERSDAHGDDAAAPLALTDSGRPRRQAAPTFGTDAEVDITGATPTPGRQRRQPDIDGTQEKVSRRGKAGKEKAGRKTKNQPLAAAPVPAPSPVKVDRKERVQGVKAEEDMGKRQPELPMPNQPLLPTHPPPPVLLDDPHILQNDPSIHPGLGTGIIERPRSNTNSRPGPSSYWSVTEQTDFHRNVAHFGTDWAAIAHHMGTKTQTMVKNQYLRLVEGGNSPELSRLASEADKRRERGEDLGPPPTPTPAPKRRYENTQTNLPRTLAPTPEVTELSRSPSAQPVALPRFSPPHPNTGRFSSIAQAPQPATNIVPAGAPVPIPETQPTAPLSKPRQQSPPPPAPSAPAPAPQRTPSLHLHNGHGQQHKSHSNGPRAGYFLDDPPPRGENRVAPQQPIVHPPRALQQQLQPHIRSGQEQLQPLYRTAVQQDRESQTRLEQQQEHDLQARFQQHSRRVSQEVPFSRQFPPNVQTSTQVMPSMRSTSGATSPEGRVLASQQSRYMPPHSQPSNQAPAEMVGQTPGPMAVPPQLQSRPTLRTPPVKEEQRRYPLPAHPPHSQQPPQIQAHPPHSQQPPQIQAQPSAYPRPTQPTTQSSTAPPPPKPAAEPKKSSLLSLLNDVPEEPKRKKQNEAPSHTPTPQQQTPVAPPPSSGHAPVPRRDFYSDTGSTQSPYSRSVYAQPPSQLPQQHPSSARQLVDHPSEQQGGRHHQRDSWQQRPYQPGQNSVQQATSHNSPHAALSQPSFGDSRMLTNHRSLLAQHNGSRPSPPPIGAYTISPHLHSRTSSMSGPSSQQSRHSMSGNTAPQTAQTPAGTSQILQPNPYAQVDPSGNGSQPVGPGDMRPSPHHPNAAQQRDMQGRNEQAQVHNANLPYSGPQTPSEHHPGHQHLRGPSISEQYRSRDARDFRGFESQIPDRDSSRELSERADFLLREQRDALLPRAGGPQQAHQDLRYQPAPHNDRGFPTQRSRTPLSRPEHAQHAPLQHPVTHSLLSENRGVPYGQRPQEKPRQPYREAYLGRDDRLTDRVREEHAYARMQQEEYMNRDHELREREMRDRDARYGHEMLRRDSRLPGPHPPPPQQAHHEQRASHGGPMDWTNAVPRQQERWQQHH